MNKLINTVLLLVSCSIFSSVSFADARQYFIAKSIASLAKQELIDEHGKFPIKLDDVSYLMNITSEKQYVVYDYKINMISKGITKEFLEENLKISLEDEICYDSDFVSIFRKNDLLLLYRYKFSDKKIIPVTLSVDDICD